MGVMETSGTMYPQNYTAGIPVSGAFEIPHADGRRIPFGRGNGIDDNIDDDGDDISVLTEFSGMEDDEYDDASSQITTSETVVCQ